MKAVNTLIGNYILHELILLLYHRTKGSAFAEMDEKPMLFQCIAQLIEATEVEKNFAGQPFVDFTMETPDGNKAFFQTL